MVYTNVKVRILELEAALEAERTRLGDLRKAQYRDTADAATEHDA